MLKRLPRRERAGQSITEADLMIDRVTLIGFLAALAAFLFVIELVRQRKLREDYSLLWLATAIALIALSLNRPLLDVLAEIIGVGTYPPAAPAAVAIVFMLFILLQFSIALTRLSRENKESAQQMAILRWELHETRKLLASRHADAERASGDQQQHETGSVER